MDKQKILEQFGKNLQKIRTDKNISQEKMALDVGFDRTYISLLERGKRNPSLITLCRLLSFLQISISDLFQNINLEKFDNI